MRLIDKDKVIELINKYFKVIELNPDLLIDSIISAPTIDAVEVVRCKDCKYSKHLKQYPKVNTWKCTLTDVVYRADDFCNYGERKDEEYK